MTSGGGGGSGAVCIGVFDVTSSGVSYSVGTGGVANNGNYSYATGVGSVFASCNAGGGYPGQSYYSQWVTNGGNGKIILLY
jgi:hypothetical protein